MYRSTFFISKMDCPSEERIIRMKLQEFTPLKKLEFNIPERIMIATHEGDAEQILNLLLPLNFGATIRESHEETRPVPINNEPDTEKRVLKLLLAINAGMFLIELVLGIFAESMGLISDSFDMFADASVYMISLYAVGKAVQVKKKSALINGYFQIILGVGLLIETVRRFIFGSDPEPVYMIFVSIAALAANVYCLYLLSGHKEKGVHMKASYICSSNDVIANAGVIVAGLLVMLTNSSIPDLLIGIIVVGFVLSGARSILSLAK